MNKAKKNTKYFLNLEKSRQNKKVIYALKENGKTLTDIQDILQTETSFYKQLYSSNLTIDDNFNSYTYNIKPDHVLNDD